MSRQISLCDILNDRVVPTWGRNDASRRGNRNGARENEGGTLQVAEIRPPCPHALRVKPISDFGDHHRTIFRDVGGFVPPHDLLSSLRSIRSEPGASAD